MLENMTKEELEYYNSLSKTEKIRYTITHKSEKEKELIEAKKQKSRSSWSEEYKKSVRHKISSTKKNKTQEEKDAQLAKFRNTINSRTQEEKEEINSKISKSVHNYFSNMTEEDHKKFSKVMSDAYKNLTDEQKKSRVEKGIATKRIKYGDDYNPMKNDCVKESIIQTNLNRYGVPYFCMTDKCRNACGGNSSNSSCNLKFNKKLLDIGFSEDKIEREFVIDNKSYDFKIGNVLIEVNPSVTHNSTWSPFGNPLDKDYHHNKTKIAHDNGYKCINVWDWDDLDKITHLLIPMERIYARNCAVKEVDKSTAKEFINKHHLQGYIYANIRIGLFYEDNLVSIMTFGKPRYNKKYQYELLRYCSSHNIIGGAEKLFKYFLKNYTPTSVISYCDLSKFTGSVYNKLGFELKNISISKHWYNMKTKKHITDNLLRQQGFDRLFGDMYGTFGKGSSNEELMLRNDFVEIYDCGQATYIYIC